MNDCANHVITLSAIGEAETPDGGSVCIRCDSMSVFGHGSERQSYPTLKSRISLRLADVDILRCQIGGAATGSDSVWLALM